jgi:hypothetical protein
MAPLIVWAKGSNRGLHMMILRHEFWAPRDTQRMARWELFDAMGSISLFVAIGFRLEW